MDTKLYHIQLDNISWWVEATSFADAIAVWKRHEKARLSEEEYDETEEPESVHLVHDEPVLR